MFQIYFSDVKFCDENQGIYFVWPKVVSFLRTITWSLVLCVLHNALRKMGPGPVTESTTLNIVIKLVNRQNAFMSNSFYLTPLPYLYRESCSSMSFKRLSIPVDLSNFFPHDSVKLAATLITKDQAEIIIILFCIHVDCTIVIQSSE